MSHRLVPFILSLSLAAPFAAGSGVCCTPDDGKTVVQMASETCCCPSAALCAGDAAAENLLETRLVAPDSSHRTPAVFLATDLSRVRSLTGSRPFRLASARAPIPTPLTVTLPLRL